MDLFTAVSTAGGLTERANRSRVELKRRAGDDFRTQILDLESDRALRLEDKDTIIVHAMPEKIIAEKVVQTITVIGEVRNPGQIALKDEQPIDIISAIAMAGGFTNIARPSKVFVRRPNPAGGSRPRGERLQDAEGQLTALHAPAERLGQRAADHLLKLPAGIVGAHRQADESGLHRHRDPRILPLA